MKGRAVELRPPEPDDFRLLARWAATSGGAGARANGGGEIHSAGELSHLVETGAFRLLVVHAGEEPVGAVSWTPDGHAGYSLAAIVGDSSRWNTGLGAEALLLLLDHLFHGRNAHRVSAVFGLHNPQGITMLTRSGFVVEGVLREYFFLDGAYHDAVVCSLLREEYYAVAASGRFGPITDVVPAADKEAARRTLREHLASLPPDQLGALLDRTPRGTRVE